MHIYECYITWARTYVFHKIVCIPEHGVSTRNNLIKTPCPGGIRPVRSLFHHLWEALAFTCFFCTWLLSLLLVTLVMPLLTLSDDGAHWAGFSVRLFLHSRTEMLCIFFTFFGINKISGILSAKLTLPFGGNAVVVTEGNPFEDGLQANRCVPTA